MKSGCGCKTVGAVVAAGIIGVVGGAVAVVLLVGLGLELLLLVLVLILVVLVLQ